MTDRPYDVIVVGARCAGSPVAMLLARRGHRVLVVDRATFPSDSVSTHMIHPPGVAALQRWGLLDAVTATGCPPIHTYAFDFGAVRLAGSPGTPEAPVAYAPRRFVLDKVLVDAAAAAGAEVREAFTVDEVLVSDGRVTGIRGHSRGGAVVTERARIVIGADGVHSAVAKAAGAEQYLDRPQLTYGYYAYYSGLPVDGRFEIYSRPRRGWAACATNDGLTMVIGGWPHAEFAANRADIEGTLLATFDQAPEFGERIRAATRESKIVGAGVPGYFRKPYGPGWALVGDAGYNKDFISAMGITDAFRDAELCAGAVHEVLSGGADPDTALGGYQSARDARAVPMYELTAQIASLEPPAPEMIGLLGAMRDNPEARDGFARVNAGVTSPAEFFTPDNIGRIMAGATG